MPPFIIYGLPRSRTFWLSRFLTYGEWFCGHDEMRYARSLDDVRMWFSQAFTGSAETIAAPFWRLQQKYRPDARVVVVRRPVEAVVDSLLRCSQWRDPAALTAAMRRLDRKLEQIAARAPGALSVQFDDLAREDVCATVFEHCLPYKHDPAWWRTLAPMNLQIHFPAMVRYVSAYLPQLGKLERQARQQMFAALSARPVVEAGAITLQQERFDDWYRDAKPLFEEHMVQTGQDVDDYSRKNLPLLRKLDELGYLQVTTARCNGRLFGYLMAVLSPSLDSPDVTSAMHLAFFADKSFPGLGMKLQRASVDALHKRGVGEVYLRAGTRGSGPRLGTLYQRLGAEDAGHLYRLGLED